MIYDCNLILIHFNFVVDYCVTVHSWFVPWCFTHKKRHSFSWRRSSTDHSLLSILQKTLLLFKQNPLVVINLAPWTNGCVSLFYVPICIGLAVESGWSFMYYPVPKRIIRWKSLTNSLVWVMDGYKLFFAIAHNLYIQFVLVLEQLNHQYSITLLLRIADKYGSTLI